MVPSVSLVLLHLQTYYKYIYCYDSPFAMCEQYTDIATLDAIYTFPHCLTRVYQDIALLC